MNILWMSFLFTNAFAQCQPLEQIAKKLAVRAYNVNIEKTFIAIATRYRVPIVYREPSVPSQALQQNDSPTKRLDVKNKSSLLPFLEGFVTFNGNAGKVGDKLKAFVKKHCENDPRLCPEDKKQELQFHLDSVHHEAQMIEQKLSVRNPDGSLHYSKVPVVRENKGRLEVVVYTDETASATKWVPLTLQTLDQAAKVLGDINGTPITADTDLVFIGQPHSKVHQVGYHPLFGFRTSFDDKVRNELNTEWARISENSNQIVQHGDEANFGLNPLDDVLVAMDHAGKVMRFDLRKGSTEQENHQRALALEGYANWLAEESKYSDIILPTKKIQKQRRKSLGDSGAFFDFTDSRKDYDVIERVFHEKNAPFASVAEKEHAN